jgi:hypothetical protein
MNSKRTKCKRCTFPLSAREREYFMGYCERCRTDVDFEYKKSKK